MKLYTAFDLHANNSYAAIVDGDGRKVAGRKLDNDPRTATFIQKKNGRSGIYYGNVLTW